MNKVLLFLFTFFFAFFAQSQVSKTVNLFTAGTLSTVLTFNELNRVTNLTITGNINACDFVTMRDNMPLLAVLDISNVTISAYTGTQGTAGTTIKVYPENAIPENAFSITFYLGKIALTNITLPNSITSIESHSFGFCTGLTSIIIPNSVTSIGKEAFWGCNGLSGSLTLPNSVTSIGNNAFCSCWRLTGTLTIPNSVASIGGSAFSACVGLTNITIPNSVDSIGDYAFNDCNGLITVDANNKNYSSSEGILFDKAKKILIQCPVSKNGSYNIPLTVNSIGLEAFINCRKLTNINIPNSVTSIGAEAFGYCLGLTGTLTIPNSVISIGIDAFGSCTGLTSIILPNSVTSIEYYAFQDCTGLTSIIIPNSVTSIENYAFSGCTGLTSIIIPNYVDSIGNNTFYGCTGLTSIIIPNSVTSIGNKAFYGCIGLTSIYANSTSPIDLSLSPDAFSYVNKTTCTLYVPLGSKSAYQTADQWGDFSKIIERTTAIPTITNASINLYPNPTTDYFQVSGFYGKALITIKDLNDKILLTKQINSSEKININYLSNGVYMIDINTNEGSILKKIIKN